MSVEARKRETLRWFAVCSLCVTAVLANSLAHAKQARPLKPINQEKANQLREDLREMITLARDRVFPPLVNIRVITVRYWGGKEQKG